MNSYRCQSPLRALVSYGCKVEVMKALVEHHPEVVDKEGLRAAIEFWPGSEIFRYLLDNLPESLFDSVEERQLFGDDLILKVILMTKGDFPTEEIIRSMVETFPNIGSEVLSTVLFSNCSTNLSKWIFTNFKGNTFCLNDFDHSDMFKRFVKLKGLDHEKALASISAALPHLSSFTFMPGCQRYIQADTTHSLIEMLFQSNGMRVVEFDLRSRREPATDGVRALIDTLSTSQKLQESRIEKVVLVLTKPYLGLIKCIYKLPKLRRLDLRFKGGSDALDAAISPLLALLRDRALEGLKLDMEFGGIGFRIPNFEVGLLGVLNEGNCTLKRLIILTKEYRLYAPEDAIKECSEGFNICPMTWHDTMMQKISFNVLLNQCGRAKARNQKTTKAELVDVIHSVAEAKIRLMVRRGKQKRAQLSDELVAKVRYSLLLDSVDNWATL